MPASPSEGTRRSKRKSKVKVTTIDLDHPATGGYKIITKVFKF